MAVHSFSRKLQGPELRWWDQVIIRGKASRNTYGVASCVKSDRHKDITFWLLGLGLFGNWEHVFTSSHLISREDPGGDSVLFATCHTPPPCIAASWCTLYLHTLIIYTLQEKEILHTLWLGINRLIGDSLLLTLLSLIIYTNFNAYNILVQNLVFC